MTKIDEGAEERAPDGRSPARIELAWSGPRIPRVPRRYPRNPTGTWLAHPDTPEDRILQKKKKMKAPGDYV